MECFDGLEAPGLPLLALGFSPDDRLPVRSQDQARAGIGKLDPVTGRLPDVKKERSLNRVLVRSGFDVNPVLQKDVGGPENVLSRVRRVGDVMETGVTLAMFFSAGEIVSLVVDREPAATNAAIVEPGSFPSPSRRGRSA